VALVALKIQVPFLRAPLALFMPIIRNAEAVFAVTCITCGAELTEVKIPVAVNTPGLIEEIAAYPMACGAPEERVTSFKGPSGQVVIEGLDIQFYEIMISAVMLGVAICTFGGHPRMEPGIPSDPLHDYGMTRKALLIIDNMSLAVAQLSGPGSTILDQGI